MQSESEFQSERPGGKLYTVNKDKGEAPSADLVSHTRLETERTRWDPKDGELCLSRVKPGETLVEARRDTDVQIVRWTWV